jgi:hypothetical protein
MKNLFFTFVFLIGIFSFAQNSIITTEGNLKIEWDESIKNLMAECPPPREEKEFCQGARVQVF